MDFDEIIQKRFKIRSDDTMPAMGRRRRDRNLLASLFSEFGFKKGAEIGVFKGEYSNVLLENNPELKLICVDLWDDIYGYKGDDLFQSTIENTVGFNVDLKRMSSLEGSLQVEDESLDFVYVDANHEFDNAMIDLILWSKKVRKGGMIAGHDYNIKYKYGVIDAAQAYTKAHNVNKWYITNERVPTFFWVKQ